jgi:hypothetical protein
MRFAMSKNHLATAAFAILVAGTVLPTPADARYLFRSTHAGVACHPANGSLASSFNYTLQTLTNVGTVDAYVICALPMDDLSTYPTQLHYLVVNAVLPQSGTTLACTAQVGAFYSGTTHIRESVARATTSSQPNAQAQLSWYNELAPERAYGYDVLSLNCKLPPGAKLGLIQREDAEPEIVSG